MPIPTMAFCEIRKGSINTPRQRHSTFLRVLQHPCSCKRACVGPLCYAHWLVRNLWLDKFRQKSERFLPAEIASIRGNDIGDTFLHNFYLCSTGYFVQRNRRSHFSGQGRVIELACVTNTFVGCEFEICSAERMAIACGEIAERHLIRTTDFRVHMVNLSSESVRRKPPSHSVRVNKRSVDFLGRRAKHTVKLDGVGNHEQFSFRCASVKPVDTGSDM